MPSRRVDLSSFFAPVVPAVGKQLCRAASLDENRNFKPYAQHVTQSRSSLMAREH